jgi:hypothetical protein
LSDTPSALIFSTHGRTRVKARAIPPIEAIVLRALATERDANLRLSRHRTLAARNDA